MTALANVRQLRPTLLLGAWIVPPENKDKPAEVAYATCGWWIYRRTRALSVTLYHRTQARKCKARDFEPWKRAPEVPENRWQLCTAEQAGDA